MTGVLAFVLGTAAAMAIAGAAVSLLTAFAWAPVSRLAAATRADFAAVMAVVPAGAAFVVGGAVSVPSSRHALGYGEDHCAEHLHHAHLCWLHGDGISPAVATLGATAIAVFAWRATSRLHRAYRADRAAAILRRLGVERDGVVWVPGSVRLCHVAGALRPRIVVSERLARELDPPVLAVMLEHKRAHASRRDPSVARLVDLAAPFGLPPIGARWAAAWRQAAEEAADAEAARVHGAMAVASALVAFGRCIAPAHPAVGFGPLGLEARVVRLLDRPAARRSHAGPLLLGLGVLLVGLACAWPDAVHHRVEDWLHAGR